MFAARFHKGGGQFDWNKPVFEWGRDTSYKETTYLNTDTICALSLNSFVYYSTEIEVRKGLKKQHKQKKSLTQKRRCFFASQVITPETTPAP